MQIIHRITQKQHFKDKNNHVKLMGRVPLKKAAGHNLFIKNAKSKRSWLNTGIIEIN